MLDERLGIHEWIMDNAPRTIIPHKGGRTERAPSARLTGDAKTKLQRILDTENVSFGDWLDEQIEIYYNDMLEIAQYSRELRAE